MTCKVLTTGSKGFIGRNIYHNLLHDDNFEIYEYSRNTSEEKLIKLLKKVDFIIHLAGANRPHSDNLFKVDNFQFTKYLCNLIEKNNLKIPIVFTSSIHVERENEYGRTKLQAEKTLIEYSKRNKIKVHIYRLPHVVGKWCKPNYNSVVATFCHNIAKNLPIQIDNPNFLINIIYIDDLINHFKKVINNSADYATYCEVEESYEISIGDLANKIYNYRKLRLLNSITEVGSGIDRILYATFISYFEPEMFSYPVSLHSDPRGEFAEIVKTRNSGQFSFFTINIGETRGGHYHHTKNEKFLVVKGSAEYKFRNIDTNERFKISSSDNHPMIVETIPGWVHDITNTGIEKAIVFLWANEVFDKLNPDTFYEEL